MIDTSPEYLDVLERASEWQAAYDLVCTLEARAYTSRDWEMLEEARAELARAIGAWGAAHIRWTQINRVGG